MSAWTATSTIVISCGRGLAACAAQEVVRLGYAIADANGTTVSVRGTLLDAMRLNLWLRTAHRVLWPLAAQRARDLDALYAVVRHIRWEHWLDPNGYFTVNAAVLNSSVRDTRMPALRAKDAIADAMRAACGRRPDAGSEFHGASIFVYWRDQDLRIYLDTTGEPLARRGYRRVAGPAPMQETLAAACVLATEWSGESAFVSPMCGSGTPAIEAALIARRRAPGIFRERFAFMSLNGYRPQRTQVAPPAAARRGVRPLLVKPESPAAAVETPPPTDSPEARWQTLREEARRGERVSGLPVIVATDHNAQVVALARQNAAAAGVEDMLSFQVCDFADTAVPPGPGVVFLNPEYGERMGDAAALAPLYGRIGDFLKQRCAGYAGYVLTGSRELSLKIGLRSSRRLPFFNGPIECRLLAFDIYDGTHRQRFQQSQGAADGG